MKYSTRLALALAFLLVGCSKAPSPTLPQGNLPSQVPVLPLAAEDTAKQAFVPLAVPQTPWNADGRFIAFTACRPRDGGIAGSLFLWDDALKDIYLLNGALAGLKPEGKAAGGPLSCVDLEQLNPWIFAPGKILLCFGRAIYVYDMLTEERILGVSDGQAPANGGPRATITADGKLLTYISNKGTIVLKPVDPLYATKTRELTKIAAEVNALHNQHEGNGTIRDAGISGDGHWLVVNVNGLLYLYDVENRHLFQLLPLSGKALAGNRELIGHVAISHDGRLIAFTVGTDDLLHNRDFRLLVLDRQTGMIDTVPSANSGDTISGSAFSTVILNPRFCHDNRSLLFETALGVPAAPNQKTTCLIPYRDFRVWRYDLLTETLRSLVILNNVLGENDTQILESPRMLN